MNARFTQFAGSIIISTLCLSLSVHGFNDELDYTFSGQLALQYSGYFGDEDPAAGFVLPDDEYMLRKAAICLEGRYGKYVTFGMEIGSERCPSSASDAVKVLDGFLFFAPTETFKIGMSRGHVLRGYQLNHDCTDLLTGEKVRWTKAVAACHPTGMVARFDTSFATGGALALEFSYNNGPNTEKIEDEHDLNIGIQYDTPVDGLSLTGFYTDIEADFDLDQTIDKGDRMGIGARYDNGTFVLGGEYYSINGIASPFETVSNNDLEMRAWYMESGYRFKTGEMFPYIQPYVRYQVWDKGTNAPGDNEYHYLDVGLTAGIGGFDAFLRIDYQTRIGEPDNVIDEEDMLIVRLQLNL
ncbi:hypothetical protein JXA80_03210 [bacterium]|nr:hypothetical protein [candidate division CSSED10-310 bacterium]